MSHQMPSPESHWRPEVGSVERKAGQQSRRSLFIAVDALTEMIEGERKSCRQYGCANARVRGREIAFRKGSWPRSLVHVLVQIIR